MNREEYREVYLRSAHWLEVRKGALERAGKRCQVCNGTKHLDVHHRTYERLGEEQDADLTVLCRGCHDLFHNEAKASTGLSKRGQAALDELVRRAEVGEVVAPKYEMTYRALRVLVEQQTTTSARMAFILDTTAFEAGQLLSQLRSAGLAERPAKYWKPTREGRKAMKRRAA